ncbi:MAG: phosphatase PAP2 family protein [Candidatus Liptonbacteria bacterium]|nr:phosphatase PAP2 family protein [Candidatus Liptonbacteria bacterium]
MDSLIFNFIHGLSGRGFFLDVVGIFAAKYLPYFLYAAFIWLVILQPGWRLKLFFSSEAAIAVILSRGLITEIINFFYYSPRPLETLSFQALISESGSSMPSGHAALFFALSLIIYIWNRRWGIWYFILSLIIGLARIFVGVHWPLDIVAGAAIGIVSALLVHWVLSGYYGKVREQKNMHS